MKVKIVFSFDGYTIKFVNGKLKACRQRFPRETGFTSEDSPTCTKEVWHVVMNVIVTKQWL